MWYVAAKDFTVLLIVTDRIVNINTSHSESL